MSSSELVMSENDNDFFLEAGCIGTIKLTPF